MLLVVPAPVFGDAVSATSIENQIASLDKAIAQAPDLKKSLTAVQSEISADQSQLSALQTQQQNAPSDSQIQTDVNNTSQSVSAEQSDYQNVLNQLQQLNGVQSQINGLNSDISSLKNQYQALIDQETKVEDATAGVIQQANDRINKLDMDIATEEQGIQAAKASGQLSLEIQFETAEADFVSKRLAWKKKINTLQNSENSTLSEITQKQSKVSGEISSDNSSLNSLENQYPNLGVDEANLQSQEQDISSVLTALKNQLTSAQNELNRNSQASSQETALQNDIVNLQSQEQGIESELQAIAADETQKANLETELETLNQETQSSASSSSTNNSSSQPPKTSTVPSGTQASSTSNAAEANPTAPSQTTSNPHPTPAPGKQPAVTNNPPQTKPKPNPEPKLQPQPQENANPNPQITQNNQPEQQTPVPSSETQSPASENNSPPAPPQTANSNPTVNAPAPENNPKPAPSQATSVPSPRNVSITFSMSNPSMSVGENDSTVAVAIPTAPITESGQPYLPAGSVAKALGAAVAWTQATQRVDLITATDTISFWIGGNTALVNGKDVTIDKNNLSVTPVMESPGYAMIPAGFLSSVLHESLSYNQATGTISMSGPGQASPFGVLVGTISEDTIAQLANMLQQVIGNPETAQQNAVSLIEKFDRSLNNGGSLKFAATKDKLGQRISSEENLKTHYDGHAQEFEGVEGVDVTSEEGYQQIGQDIVDSWKSGSSDIQSFTYFYKNNALKARIGLYDSSRNIFVSIEEDVDGNTSISTIFRPSGGARYLLKAASGLSSAVALSRQTLIEVAKWLRQHQPMGNEIPDNPDIPIGGE